ncbi:SIS domain-containing protein [Kitasatospora sp. NPDC056138]|uniref:SIS domain-containing protein n=1 Tax=Kitasatospora sp. NPDC056138 TaxID=3345724 RepID=UPI0035DBB18D
MFDDTLLDDPAALQRADRDHALLALAGTGARVRTALRLADAAGLAGLRPDGRPRTVLVAGHGSTLAAGAVVAALAVTGCQVLPLAPGDAAPIERGEFGPAAFTSGMVWQLPGWAGPFDLVVIGSAQGGEQGLISLAEQVYARGCAVVVIAPEGSLLAEAALQVRGLPLPYVPSASPGLPEDEPRAAGDEPDLPAEDPGALWALLAPLLALTEKVGVTQLPPGSLEAAADRLDEVAVRCRPDAAGYLNPAKELAGRIAGTVPLLWAEGAVAGAAAERFAAMLAERAGRPALTGLLPGAITAHRGMFVGQLAPAAADPDDFFRDRVEEPDPLQLQVLLLRTPGENGGENTWGNNGGNNGGNGGERGREGEPGAGVRPGGHSVLRAHRLAEAHEVRLTECTSGRPDPLQALAELIGLTDFAAVYLGLASSSG